MLIGLGAWFEILDQNFEAIVDGDQLVYGAYLTIAAGWARIILSVIGICGAICDYKANRVLLFVVSFGSNIVYSVCMNLVKLRIFHHGALSKDTP